MRKRFEQQLELGTVPIGEVEINIKSRHDLPPVLIGLKYCFNNEETSSQIFEKLEIEILGNKQRTGRLGMSLWEILVLGVVRLSLNLDFDFLHDLANNHIELRGILGINRTDFSLGKQYHYQTLKDNVQLLDESILKEINEIVVKGAHELIKKNEGIEAINLELKAHSFVVLNDIHFPTDLNLLWDSTRKCLNIVGHLRGGVHDWSSWYQHGSWYGKAHSSYNQSTGTSRSG